jgi:hypothetical protein
VLGSVEQARTFGIMRSSLPDDHGGTLETVRWEAETVGRLLGTRVAALVCVHGAHVRGGGLNLQGVAIVPAHLLGGALGDDRALSDADVALLTTSAWTRLRPAALRAQPASARTATSRA